MKVSEPDDTLVGDVRGWSALARLRSGFSGPASELPDRRRVSDWIRLVAGVVTLLLLLAHHNHESQTEKDIYNAVRALPQGINSAVHLFYGLARSGRSRSSSSRHSSATAAGWPGTC